MINLASLRIHSPLTILSTISSSGTSIIITRETSAILESSSAYATVLGNPSKSTPLEASFCDILSEIRPMIILSGTRRPASMYPLASMPSCVPSLTAALSMSPVETCGFPVTMLMISCLGSLPCSRRSEQYD